MEEMAKNGITSCVDARTYWTRGHHKTWQEAHDKKELTVKAVLSLWIYPQRTDDQKQIDEIKAMYKNGI